MHRNQKSGFTLIELLVVIAVIAIIAAILFPVFARVREKVRQTVCCSNMKQISAAVTMYIQDYDETLPFVLNFSGNGIDDANTGDGGKWPAVPGVSGAEPRFRLVTLVAPYVKNERIWYCPSVGTDYHWDVWKKGVTMRDQGTTYGYTYLGLPLSQDSRQIILLGGRSDAIVHGPSRWPMLWEQPNGLGFTGNIGDPPSSVVPHFAGMNIGYGDGHAKFYRMETADGSAAFGRHVGDGVIQGQ